MTDDLSSAIDRARARAASGAKAASDHADLVYGSWTERAVVYIRLYSLAHGFMRCEHVRVYAEVDGFEAPPDKRAWGQAMMQAQREGVVESAGYEAAISSNGSPKVRWKSLLYNGYRESIE